MEKECVGLKPEYTIIKSPDCVLSPATTTEELCSRPLKKIVLTDGERICGLSEEEIKRLRSLDPKSQKEAKEKLLAFFQSASAITIFHKE